MDEEEVKVIDLTITDEEEVEMIDLTAPSPPLPIYNPGRGLKRRREESNMVEDIARKRRIRYIHREPTEPLGDLEGMIKDLSPQDAFKLFDYLSLANIITLRRETRESSEMVTSYLMKILNAERLSSKIEVTAIQLAENRKILEYITKDGQLVEARYNSKRVSIDKIPQDIYLFPRPLRAITPLGYNSFFMKGMGIYYVMNKSLVHARGVQKSFHPLLLYREISLTVEDLLHSASWSIDGTTMVFPVRATPELKRLYSESDHENKNVFVSRIQETTYFVGCYTNRDKHIFLFPAESPQFVHLSIDTVKRLDESRIAILWTSRMQGRSSSTLQIYHTDGTSIGSYRFASEATIQSVSNLVAGRFLFVHFRFPHVLDQYIFVVTIEGTEINDAVIVHLGERGTEGENFVVYHMHIVGSILLVLYVVRNPSRKVLRMTLVDMISDARSDVDMPWSPYKGMRVTYNEQMTDIIVNKMRLLVKYR